MNTNNVNESWEPCESGLLVGCANQAKSAKNRKTATQVGSGVATLLVAVGLVAWSVNYWNRPNEYHFGGIACHEVHENVPAMIAGTLPEDVMQRMQVHLKECPMCQKMMAEMNGQQASREQASQLKIARLDASATGEPVLLAVEPLGSGFLGPSRR